MIKLAYGAACFGAGSATLTALQAAQTGDVKDMVFGAVCGLGSLIVAFFVSKSL